MADSPPAVAHPAATVVLVRDTPDDYEVLLVRRSARLEFHGGAWVFPGGRIDGQDYEKAGTSDVVAAAREAAVREAREETGLAVAADELVLLSRWITPDFLPKRFDAWFFAAPGGHDEVQVDGAEIRDHRWLRPAEALAARRRGEIELPPPTFVTIVRLADFRRAGDVLAASAGGPVETFDPHICGVADGACALYEGDAGYAAQDPASPGPRHRLWMTSAGWQYECNLIREP